MRRWRNAGTSTWKWGTTNSQFNKDLNSFEYLFFDYDKKLKDQLAIEIIYWGLLVKILQKEKKIDWIHAPQRGKSSCPPNNGE